MQDDIWLGLDVGTQSVRAVALTATGAVAGSGAAPLSSRRAAPRHEQDPEAWWEATGAACRVALSGAGRGRRVCAVAACATSG
ncbi:MAG: carbohydrate kinase, partial [Actinobacteria bacterium]|nr:carbohydrate kinase [Actinomycetota bacterium]